MLLDFTTGFYTLNDTPDLLTNVLMKRRLWRAPIVCIVWLHRRFGELPMFFCMSRFKVITLHQGSGFLEISGLVLLWPAKPRCALANYYSNKDNAHPAKANWTHFINCESGRQKFNSMPTLMRRKQAYTQLRLFLKAAELAYVVA